MRAADLPERLRAGVVALVRTARGDDGWPMTTSRLDALSSEELAFCVEAVIRILDAAQAVADHQAVSIFGVDGVMAAAEAARHLDAQGSVLLTIGRNGVVTVSTWTEQAGRPSLGLAEWARGLEGHAITPVPFQTLFGWGYAGLPTRLTAEQLATLNPSEHAYAERLSFPEGEPS